MVMFPRNCCIYNTDGYLTTGHVIEHVGDLTKIVYIEYRGIWPVSNRDFCSYSATRVLKNNIVVYFASHVSNLLIFIACAC